MLSPTTFTLRNLWRPNELEHLGIVARQCATWEEVAKHFLLHSAADCRQKWYTTFALEAGTRNTRSWSADEDARLRNAMSTQRPWITVAHMVQTREYVSKLLDVEVELPVCSYRQCQSRWHRMLQQGIAVPQADAAIAHEVLATTIESATTFERPESEEIEDLFRYWQSEDSIPGPAASDNSHVGAATDVASMFDPAMHSAPVANTPVETAEPLETTTTVVAHVAMSEDELAKWFSDTFLQELPMHV